MFTYRRSSWTDPKFPITGPAINWAAIDTVVIHYTGADDLIDGDPGEHADALDDYHRSMQRSYVTNRGYSLGYNVSVDFRGHSWEIRGTDIKCAANKGHNDRTWAILMLVDGADMANHDQIDAVRTLVTLAETLAGRPLKIVGHGQLSGAATACPGVGLLTQIRAGVFTPQPPPPPPEDDDMARQIIINDGDPAVFLQDGIFATWVKDEATRDAIIAAGYGPPVPVDRKVLKALELRGPAPTYDPMDTRPKTSPLNFARHEP